MKSELVETVINLMKNRPYTLTVREIHKATGLPQGWIYRLQQGKIVEPSANRCEVLYEFLTGSPLEL